MILRRPLKKKILAMDFNTVAFGCLRCLNNYASSLSAPLRASLDMCLQSIPVCALTATPFFFPAQFLCLHVFRSERIPRPSGHHWTCASKKFQCAHCIDSYASFIFRSILVPPKYSGLSVQYARGAMLGPTSISKRRAGSNHKFVPFCDARPGILIPRHSKVLA